MQPLHMLMTMGPTLERIHNRSYDLLLVKDNKFFPFKGKLLNPDVLEKEHQEINEYNESVRKALDDGKSIPIRRSGLPEFINLFNGNGDNWKLVENSSSVLIHLYKNIPAKHLEYGKYYLIEDQVYQLVTNLDIHSTIDEPIIVFEKWFNGERNYIIHRYYREYYDEVLYTNTGTSKNYNSPKDLSNNNIMDLLKTVDYNINDYIYQVIEGVIYYTKKFIAPLTEDEIDFEPLQVCDIDTQHECSDFEDLDTEIELDDLFKINYNK